MFLSSGDAEDDGSALPTSSTDEFKPFVRRLPEFKFWLSTQRAILLAFAATFFQALNIPVCILYSEYLLSLVSFAPVAQLIKFNVCRCSGLFWSCISSFYSASP